VVKAVLRRLLHRLLRRPAAAPGFGPDKLPPTQDRDGWWIEHVSPGVTRHTPPSGPVQMGPACDLLRPPPLHPPQRASGLFQPHGSRSDGTAGTVL